MSTDKDNRNTTIGSIDFSAFDAELENLVNVISELNSRQSFDTANGLNNGQKETNDYRNLNSVEESIDGINRKKGRVIKKLDLQKVREAIEEATELKKKHNGKKKNT